MPAQRHTLTAAPALAGQAAAGFDAWERLLADALGRMRERGELRADAEPATLATALLASIEGGMVLSQARGDVASLRVAVSAGLGQVRALGNLGQVRALGN